MTCLPPESIRGAELGAHLRIRSLELLHFPTVSEAAAAAFQAQLAAWVPREHIDDRVECLAKPGQGSSISILGQS